jgi:small neutral amino acid transporter SnatA (MarC family)
MFVPEKITFLLDKGTMIAALGVVLATCGLIMLKNSVEKIIYGSLTHNVYTRIKSLVTMTFAITFLFCGLFTIINSESMLSYLMEYIPTISM